MNHEKHEKHEKILYKESYRLQGAVFDVYKEIIFVLFVCFVVDDLQSVVWLLHRPKNFIGGYL